MFGFIPGWKVFSTLIGLTAFALVAVLVYENFFAGPDELTRAEVRVVDGLMPTISLAVQEFADQHQLRSVAVSRLQGDTPSGQISEQIRSRLDRAMSGKGVRVVGTGFTTRLRDAVLGSDEPGEDAEEREADVAEKDSRRAVRDEVAKNRLVDFVLYGAVRTFKQDRDAQVEVDLRLQGAEESMHRRIQAQLSTLDDIDVARTGGIQLGGFAEFLWRLLVFLIVGFFLPVVAGPFAIYGFRMDSNAVNFLMLAGLTLLAGLLAFALTGFSTNGWAIVAVLIALTAAGFWNFRVLEVWERRS